MGKTKIVHELTTVMAKALRHRIGSMVNHDEVYAQKYARDADILMKEAKKTAAGENWNPYGKAKIREELERKLHDELAKRDFLDSRKFDIMEEEIDKALRELGLVLKGVGRKNLKITEIMTAKRFCHV